MSKETNLATQEKAAALLNDGDVDGFVDTLFAEDALDHDPAPDQGPGREGFRTFFRMLTTAFPDAHLEPVAQVADDDHVAFAYTLSGTHEGAFLGVPASGRHMEVRGLQLARFENGQVVERWGSSDELGMLRKIGDDRDGRSLVDRVRHAFDGHGKD